MTPALHHRHRQLPTYFVHRTTERVLSESRSNESGTRRSSSMDIDEDELSSKVSVLPGAWDSNWSSLEQRERSQPSQRNWSLFGTVKSVFTRKCSNKYWEEMILTACQRTDSEYSPRQSLPMSSRRTMYQQYPILQIAKSSGGQSKSAGQALKE
jgi:hypothetical protein